MKIETKLDKLNIPVKEIHEKRSLASSALDELWGSKEPAEAWVQLPMNYTEDDIEYLLNAADYIKGWAKLLIVIGSPENWAGAQAGIGALPKFEYGIDVQFIGDDLNPARYAELVEKLKANETAICVVSDYEKTPETAAAFAILKHALREKTESEEGTAQRIIAITGKDTRLREEAEREGYLTVTSSSDFEGSKNILSIAGLLPMAVAGLDVRAILEGAKTAALSPLWDAGGADYAIIREMLRKDEKHAEILALTDVRLKAFAPWLRTLCGEGELEIEVQHWPEAVAKAQRKGAFETVIQIDEGEEDMIVPAGPLAGKSLRQLHSDAVSKAMKDRKADKSPLAEISLPALDADAFGQLVYFFEMSHAISKLLQKSC